VISHNLALVEAAGIEPSAEIVASVSVPCSCEWCISARAANALHSGDTQSPCLSTPDATLHWLIRHWAELPKAIMAVIRRHIEDHALQESDDGRLEATEDAK